MPIQDDIDNAAQQMADLVDKATAELIQDLYNVGSDTGDLNAFTNAILNVDIEGTLKAKLVKATQVYADAHRQVLEGTIGFANIDSDSLVSFAQLDEQLFNKSVIGNISEHIRNEIVKGISVGLSANEIVQLVSNSSISNAQMQTLVTTTLNDYSRSVTNRMMLIAPANTKYIYIGPNDEKTRDECLEYINAGRLTRQQIVSKFGEKVLNKGGGFNCRHKWK
jgi:hypothetical protein